MIYLAQSITATGVAMIAASSPVVRRTVKTFFIPAGRHRGTTTKSD